MSHETSTSRAISMRHSQNDQNPRILPGHTAEGEILPAVAKPKSQNGQTVKVLQTVARRSSWNIKLDQNLDRLLFPSVSMRPCPMVMSHDHESCLTFQSRPQPPGARATQATRDSATSSLPAALSLPRTPAGVSGCGTGDWTPRFARAGLWQ